MTDEEKIKLLKEQIHRLKHNDSEVERLQAEIRRMGFVPAVKAGD